VFDPLAVPSYTDAKDANDPLDLRAASFGQSGTDIVLRLRTAQPWKPRDLAPQAMCVALHRGTKTGQICVGVHGDRPALRYTRPGDTTAHVLDASVRRPDRRSLTATFSARQLRIRAGRVKWRVETLADSMPDRGRYVASTSAYGTIPCFGAAARRTRNGCENPALRHRVFPSPADAEVTPDSPCVLTADRKRYTAIEPCAFGDLRTTEAPRVALIGDSHSGHLRAAVDVFARARGWRAISMTRPGCAFSTEAYAAPPPIPQRCRLHTAEALQWLRRHRSVTTVFTSNAAGRGLGAGGFLAAWRQVAASVKRIYEIRDVPRVHYATANCVRSAMRSGMPTVGACSVARGGAFPADGAAAAAAGAGGRIHLIDLTRYFCDASRCYPVIGGAYVYKDFNHLNRVFAATLGPALLRATDDR
jgi:hypothetical protein